MTVLSGKDLREQELAEEIKLVKLIAEYVKSEN